MSATRSIDALAVGDCFNPPSDAVWTTFRVVRCSEPHVYEVISLGQFQQPAGTTWPGEDALHDGTRSKCIEDFPGYVGIAYNQSHLEVHVSYPSKDSWDSGGRQALCLVKEPDSSTWTGSARNLRR